MEKIRLCFINEEYINFLREFDNRVGLNKNNKRVYVGVVLKIENYLYFAPLSSPKEKHKNLNSKKIDIVKINEGKLGVINLNNMIPTDESLIIDCFNYSNLDKKYLYLLSVQMRAIEKYRDNLYKKSSKLYRLKINNKLNDRYNNRCCDFKLLENALDDYLQMQNNNELSR